MELTIATKLFVTAMLVVAAVIDGVERRVPNWLTFPVILAGLIFGAWNNGLSGFGLAFAGALAGLFTLIVPYALNGMGAGDVKMMAAMGAWIGPMLTLKAFVVSAMVGGVIGLTMILCQKHARETLHRLYLSFVNLMLYRDLAVAVPEGYVSSTKLPYGIPIAIGSIATLFLLA